MRRLVIAPLVFVGRAAVQQRRARAVVVVVRSVSLSTSAGGEHAGPRGPPLSTSAGGEHAGPRGPPRRRGWRAAAAALAAAAAAAGAAAAATRWRTESPQQLGAAVPPAGWVPHPVAAVLLAAVSSGPAGSPVLVVGPPGAGKSAAAAMLGAELRGRGVHVLDFVDGSAALPGYAPAAFGRRHDSAMLEMLDAAAMRKGITVSAGDAAAATDGPAECAVVVLDTGAWWAAHAARFGVSGLSGLSE